LVLGSRVEDRFQYPDLPTLMARIIYSLGNHFYKHISPQNPHMEMIYTSEPGPDTELPKLQEPCPENINLYLLSILVVFKNIEFLYVFSVLRIRIHIYLVSWIRNTDPDPGGPKLPTKVNKIQFLKCQMFSFEG
jgi:hypothetical protein